MQPFKLKPILKNYIWGSETWILSDENLILDGEFKNKTLLNFFNGHSPLVLKLIDAKDFLSIQVHPDKDEMWLILDHKPDAFLYLGFKRDISKKEFEDAIFNNTLIDLLNKVYVKKGDILFVKAGTVHAIGSGILLAEVQDNSNLTYRIYDFDRGRELNINKALDVIDFSFHKINNFNKFNLEFLKINYKINKIKNINKFEFIPCLNGNLVLYFNNIKFNLFKGDNIFIPADSCSEYVLDSNYAEILLL